MRLFFTMDRQTCLIGWTDEHAYFDELTNMPDLIPTLLFSPNIHPSGTSMLLCVFSLRFIETSHLYYNYQRLDFILGDVLYLFATWCNRDDCDDDDD